MTLPLNYHLFHSRMRSEHAHGWGLPPAAEVICFIRWWPAENTGYHWCVCTTPSICSRTHTDTPAGAFPTYTLYVDLWSQCLSIIQPVCSCDVISGKEPNAAPVCCASDRKRRRYMMQAFRCLPCLWRKLHFQAYLHWKGLFLPMKDKCSSVGSVPESRLQHHTFLH